MKLTAPKNSVWGIAVGLGVLGLISHFVNIPHVSPYAFWLLGAGFVILAVACLLKGV